MRTWWLLALALTGCGDDGETQQPTTDAPQSDATPADADTRDIRVRLESLPGVTVAETACNYDPQARCFDLSFEQPVDHALPDGAKFQQNVTLVHKDVSVPLVAVTTGYWNFYGDYPYELTQLLAANQIVIEHRFFASSRPSNPDWSKLTIQQSAADQHRITELLHPIYTAPWLTTGASKGGMTATYHRRFYPDDVQGTVPYVAPLSTARGDTRYATLLDTIGPAPCRQALRDVAANLLGNTRFEAMVTRAQTAAAQSGATFDRVALRPAVESAIVGIEWAFWQYAGLPYCDQVPATTASDAQMFGFLQQFSGITSDADLDMFDAYYFQAEYELGYPDDGTGDYLAGKTRYTEADYAGATPPGVTIPAYRPEAMQDIANFVATNGSRLLFVYGEWDPWTGGKYDLGSATDSQLFVVPQATHGAGLAGLQAADKQAAYDRIEQWTGVRPDDSRLGKLRTAKRPDAPRIPPTVLRALQLRR